MFYATDTATVTISVMHIDILALKKLALVSHALATKFELGARQEQETLASTLDDLIRRIELAAYSKR